METQPYCCPECGVDCREETVEYDQKSGQMMLGHPAKPSCRVLCFWVFAGGVSHYNVRRKVRDDDWRRHANNDTMSGNSIKGRNDI